ncbi:MAG: threonylcarbamoyl-AMP synthase [Spirochaetaceae bacterium]|jgi:tRNA threonylcarbamoyl adenosine modification protein (Sua5/YciO/YrdC/YwlC family)|nr:threonylcarbamoyl-AMP synthase [Spirochaetaceae bacterium]
MIEYVVPWNIDDRILSKAARVLEDGGLVALPTDTSWSICCSIHSRAGIEKLRSISGERDERHFTLLCSEINQFSEFCSIDNSRFRIIKRLTPGPYTFILKSLHGAEKILQRKRSELGVRIPNHPIPQRLIETKMMPLYCITAKREMAGEAINEEEHLEEDDLFEGGWELDEIDGLDMILDGGEEEQRVVSTVLDMTGDDVVLLRQGEGKWPM